jgi:hypothetical protein
MGVQALGYRHLALGCHVLPQKVPKAARGWGCAPDCRHLMLGCHALGARVRHTHLVADPGKQVCRTARLGPKVLLGHCSMT